LTDKTVELPLNSKVYEQRLKKLIAGSKLKRPVKAAVADLSKSFGK
jgi:hypothetical protein